MRTLVSLALLGFTSGAIAGPLPPLPGMTLAFDEEFDGASLDATKWTTLHPDGYRRMPGNEEEETYVDGTILDSDGLPRDLLPFKVAGGRLTITAKALTDAQSRKAGAAYVSGMVTTAGKFEFSYGYLEVKASLPSGDGLWPALWLMRRDTRPYAEIDLMEMLGHEPARIYQTIIHGSDWKDRKIEQKESLLSDPAGAHVYGVDWESDGTTFYVDGKETASFPASASAVGPMYVLVNLAVGGKWGKAPDRSRLPASMSIDYVRVWQRR